MNRMTDKNVIVTGGSLGIGQAACRRLALEGARVAVTDLKDEEGERVAAALRDDGAEARYWHLDVASEENVETVFDQIADTFGRIDVLVNNAGITGADKPTHETSEAEWQQVIDVNVKGVFFCTKHAVRHMRRSGGGSIVNLSSIYGIIGAPDIPAYHASKGAVRLMTKTDALLYAGEGIRVNSVHPGFIWTPLVEAMGRNTPGGAEGFRRHLDTLHPIGHVGEPEDVANGILYLASDEARFVTGSELVIDGGYTAR
jgi:NAD(P)-dependent dehydrogenase (short-subunit alcohol dehydrogenase family)